MSYHEEPPREIRLRTQEVSPAPRAVFNQPDGVLAHALKSASHKHREIYDLLTSTTDGKYDFNFGQIADQVGMTEQGVAKVSKKITNAIQKTVRLPISERTLLDEIYTQAEQEVLAERDDDGKTIYEMSKNSTASAIALELGVSLASVKYSLRKTKWRIRDVFARKRDSGNT